VWAAAATYYYMLTGRYPKLDGKTDVWVAVLRNKAVPVRTYNPAVPEKLARVIDEALIDDPEIRIKSAAELKRKIEAALR